jgi:hypothetical protein
MRMPGSFAMVVPVSRADEPQVDESTALYPARGPALGSFFVSDETF